jgi:oxygen-dependent protoporphyrinogen oxidase
VPPGKGLVNLYTNDKLSQELMDEPDDIVVKRVIKSANDFLPRIGDDVEFGEVRRWPTAILHSRVGHYKDLVKFRELRIANDKRIQFAGDYFAPSTQNSASASGEQAAGLLISKLGN